MIINKYAENLTEENGIFFSKNKSEISYPKDGNEVCFKLEDNSFWFKHRNNCIVEIVKKYSPNKTFFDIGGANGFVAKGLEENGIKTVLVEPGIEGCMNAKKRGLKNIICSTLEDAGFKADSIPVAGLFDVVEHIDNDILFLKKLYTYMRPEGLLFITVPAYNFLWSKEDVEAGHYRRYTLRKLKRTLENTGFETVYSTYIFSFLIFLILLFRTIPSILGLAKTGQKKSEKEHRIANMRGREGKSLINSILTLILSLEIQQISKKKRLLFGGSCLIVAKKKDDTVQ